MDKSTQTSGFNPRPFCETCDNFLLQDEYDQGEEICPNCSMELSWPNGKEKEMEQD